MRALQNNGMNLKLGLLVGSTHLCQCCSLYILLNKTYTIRKKTIVYHAELWHF